MNNKTNMLTLTADSPASANRLVTNSKSKNKKRIVQEPSDKVEEKSEYSEFVAPNAAPSEMTRILRGEGEDDVVIEEPKELGWFKRQCVKID